MGFCKTFVLDFRYFI